MPYLVLTVVPSTSGSRSRWTPGATHRRPEHWSARDLVDLVEKDDAVLLHRSHRIGLDFLVVDEPQRLLVGEHLQRFGDLHLRGLLARIAEVLEHPLDLLGEFLHARRAKISAPMPTDETSISISLVVEFALAQLLAEFLPRGGLLGRRGIGAETDRPGRWQQCVENAIFGVVHGAVAHPLHRLVAPILDGDLDEIADDRLDIPPDIADLGEFGRLDLDEGRVCQPRRRRAISVLPTPSGRS